MSYKGKKRSKLYSPEEGYDIFAPLYDESFKLLNSFEKGRLFSFFDDLKGKKVLDIGCGTGRILGELRLFGADITAIDISEEMLGRVGRKYPDVKTAVADVEALPFEDDSFDVAVAAFLIVHLKDPQIAFEEVHRVLKSGGEFIVTNINQRKAPKLKTPKGEIVIQSYYHRPEDVVKKLEKCLFDIEKNEFVEEDGVWINQIVNARKQ